MLYPLSYGGDFLVCPITACADMHSWVFARPEGSWVDDRHSGWIQATSGCREGQQPRVPAWRDSQAFKALSERSDWDCLSPTWSRWQRSQTDECVTACRSGYSALGGSLFD
jgi:hypothetical protein